MSIRRPVMSIPAGTLIHSRDSPYARRVRIVLAELDLPYESQLHPTVYAIQDLHQLNPNLRIPVWQDNLGTLFDSALVVEYLLGRYGAHAKGGAPPMATVLRTPDRYWEDAKVLSTLEDLTGAGFILRQLALSGVDEQQVRYLQRVRQRIYTTLEWLNAQAAEEGFVPGWFSMPDIWLVCALQWAEFRSIYEWRTYTKLAGIVARYASRPSVLGTAHET